MTRSGWNWVDLGNPRPKFESSSYQPKCWAEGSRIKLREPSHGPFPEFNTILDSRRSRRSYAAPAELEDLGALLGLCCRTQQARPSNFGFDLEFRPYPASGAIHTIHLLIQLTFGDEWLRYDTRKHELVCVPFSSESANSARDAADEVIASTNATLIAFVTEPGKAAAKYECPDSLIWRDAGVLLGYLSICSEALGLSFCPLGITGEPHLGSGLDQEGRLHGVGMALLGRPNLR